MSGGPAPLPGLVDSFAGLDVTVVGDACLDSWFSGGVRGVSREGAVPVVTVSDESAAPGGAGNAARALAALGARVRLVSVVGDDAEGAALRELLTAAGVDTSGVLVLPGRRTVTKRRVVARGQLVARFDSGDTGGLPAAVEAALVDEVAAAAVGCDGLLAADYGWGVHGRWVRGAIAAAAQGEHAVLAVDAHGPQRWADAAPDLLTPDSEEVEALLSDTEAAAFRAGRVAYVLAHGEAIRRRTGAATLVATLDGEGAVVVRAGAPAQHVPVRPVEDAPGIGAGDTFVAAALLALVSSGDEVLAARVGCAAAGITVRRSGTPVCTAADLREALVPPVARRRGSGRGGGTSPGALAAEVEAHRSAGHRIVFTNGCFDVLHAGHIAYLEAARACGDLLVVAVNGDESVRRLKGPDRPVNPAGDRVAVLRGLSAVDLVTVFDEDTPADLIRLLRPDVYVKGGDYTPDMLPEAPVVQSYGGEVRIVGYVADRSTTAVIERMRSGRGA